MRAFCLSALILLCACSTSAPEEDAVHPVVLVTVATAELGTAREILTIYGSAEAGPGGEQTLVAPVEALIDHIIAPVGARVRPGDAIMVLKPGPNARLDYQKARSDAAQAEAAFARAQRLRRDSLMSDADVENARSSAFTARATLNSLSARIAGLTLHAPAAGTVQTIANTPGDLVAAGSTVARVAESGHIRARFGIDPSAARRISPGSPIAILNAGGDTVLHARVTSVTLVADPQTRLAGVFVDLPGGSAVAPGEMLRGEISLVSQSNAILIPYAALLDDGGQSYVFVVEHGIAHQRNIAVGSEQRHIVEIRRGVVAGERVVVEGGTALEDGMKVRTAKPGSLR